MSPALLPAPTAVQHDLGDRTDVADRAGLKRALVEITLLWLVVLLAIRGVVAAQETLGVHEVVLALVPFLFIYGPVLLCRIRRVDSYDYRLYVPAFRDFAAWRGALAVNLKLLAWGLVPWMVGYHLYQRLLFGQSPQWSHLLRYARKAETTPWLGDVLGALGSDPLVLVGAHVLVLVAYHLFFVAIPEEFFYRGYVQTRLNELLPRRFMVAGVPLGWGLVIASLFFAFGHSLVEFQWWHFATFFPGLLFGLLRERSGGVITGAFLHAACNVIVHVQDALYGVITPP